MQPRRASDQSSLFEHRKRGGGATAATTTTTSDGQHSSFMAQVKMRLKKEKPNGRGSNHHNHNSQTPPSCSLSSPRRFVPHRPYSCDVETLAEAADLHYPRSSTHQATRGGQYSQRAPGPFLPSLGNRRMNSSYQQLTSVVDGDENEEQEDLATKTTLKPPMAAEEDFALDSSISCSPDDRKLGACAADTKGTTTTTTITYVNFAAQKQTGPESGPAPQRTVDCLRSTAASAARGDASASGGGDPSDKVEKALLTGFRPLSNGRDEWARGSSNYSNRSSTNDGQLQRSQQQQRNRVNDGGGYGSGPSGEHSFSVIDRIQQQLTGAPSARLGAPTSQQQPSAASSVGSSPSALARELKQEADAPRHAKCQNVVVSVTSFDDDLTSVTPFSSSYHAGDRLQYLRSTSTRSGEQQTLSRSPRGSLRRGKAVDLSSYESHHHLLVANPASSTLVKDNQKPSSSKDATGSAVPVARSKRSSILRKLIGGSGSRNGSSEEALSSGSPSSSYVSSSPGTLMAAASLTSASSGARMSLAGQAATCGGMDLPSARSDFSSDSSDFKYEERVRRRIFAHYDCVSICADARPLLNGTSRLKDANPNTATGASQASKPFLVSGATNGKSPAQQSLEVGLLSPDDAAILLTSEQTGNSGKSNEIILSCPYFRNEIGGEPTRHVSLSRDTHCGRTQVRCSTISCTCPSCLYTFDNDGGAVPSNCISNAYQSQSIDENSETWHRTATAAEASVLENLSNVYLGGRLCAKRQPQLVIEHVDHGAFYYRHCFSARAHQNYFGVDENLGPVAVSVVRDKLEAYDPRRFTLTSPYLYRLIIRLSDLSTFRGAILEESLSSYLSAKESREQQSSAQSSQQVSATGTMTPSSIGSSTIGASGVSSGASGAVTSAGASGGGGNYARGKIPVKELLELAIPELQASCLRLAVPVPRTEELLLKLDEQAVYTRYKIGILYCAAQQSTEEQMYNNEISSPAFDEFLDMLGQRVRLKGFDKYKGGLDCKGDTTGSYSLYTSYQQYEIMFHVSTMLPFTPQNRQQLSRKRHIGNDIVTVIFQEPGALPFSPQTVRSHFQHVFVVVRAHRPNTDNVRYSIAVSRCKDVPQFGPPIPPGATFPKSKDFRDFLLTKIINAENAVHKSEKFAVMAARTRREFMRDLAENHTTSHTLDGGAPGKIASILLGGATKRKDRPKPKSYLDAFVRGAIVWEVQVLTQVEDFSLCRPIECYMGVSADNIVLIEQSSQEALFCTPTHSVIGWTSHGNSLKLYYDHADVIILRTLDDEDSCEMQEVIKRLQATTKGCETVEMILRRSPQGQLGFNIQHEGIVIDVEMYGYAWQAGLRQGSRIVEICKVSVATLTHERMLELLRTSVNIRVLVVPPLLEDGSPRRGCEDPYCSAVLDEDWPLASSGSFSSPRTLPETPFINETAAKRQSVCLLQDGKSSRSTSTSNRIPGPPQFYEAISRRSLNTSAVGLHQAILRLQAGSETEGSGDYRTVEPNDYGYESGPTSGSSQFSSKSLDDIQRKRDRRYSEDIRCTSADHTALLGAARRYRPSTSRAAANIPDDRWYAEQATRLSTSGAASATVSGARTDTLSSSGSSDAAADMPDVTVKRKPTRPSELKRKVDRANSDVLQRAAAASSVLERTSTAPSSSGAAETPPRAPPLPPRSYRNMKCNSAALSAAVAVGSCSSSGLGSVSDRSSSLSLNSGHLNVPRTKQRSSSSSTSVQENLIRLIADLESAGDIEEAVVISSALQRLCEDAHGRQRLLSSPGLYGTGSPRSHMRQRNPEKERGAEWSNLVDAAARAIEGMTQRSASASNSGSPELSGYRLRLQAALQRVKLLEEKVDRVQGELDTERESKRGMEIEVLRLRDVNKRLEEECTHAKMELKKFTEWFFSAVENSSGGTGDLSASRFPAGMIPFADDSERKS